MDDRDVIDGFVTGAARRAFGPTLHLEGDALFLHGWWQAAFRVAPGVFIVRNEEPREDAPALGDLVAALGDAGLHEVALDHPLVHPITYTEMAIGQVSWALWAVDLPTAEAALSARAGADTFLTDAPLGEPVVPESADFSAELGGARRLAGLPAAVILTVGLPAERNEQLQATFDDCRFVTRSFEEMPPSACGALIPTLVVVDATAETGREFVMELRAEACGRFLPVAAVTPGNEVPLGADVALDPGQPPAAWVEPLRALLP
ncbi:MAG: hypothetical protein M3Q48_12120 [Actinomycetota bacterium]|nr:hypothetical protein [Actinomycetota bacterium]